MQNSRSFSLVGSVLPLLLWTTIAHTQWSQVKRQLHQSVEVLEETPQRLVLYHTSNQDSLVLTLSREHDSDLYSGFEARRGGNYYRVWVATSKLWSHTNQGETTARQYFREEFAQAIRRPVMTRRPATAMRKPESLRENQSPAPSQSANGAPVAKASLETTRAQIPKEENIGDTIAASALRGSREEENKAPEWPGWPKEENVVEDARPMDTNPSEVEKRDAPVREAKVSEAAKSAAPSLENREREKSSARISSVVKKGDDVIAQARQENLPAPDYSGSSNEAVEKAEGNPGNEEKVLTHVQSRHRGALLPLIGGTAAALLVSTLLGFILSPELRARYFLIRGDYARAARIFERILERNPGKLKVYDALGNIYLFSNRTDEHAMKVYQTILQLNLSTANHKRIEALVAGQPSDLNAQKAQ
jgi:hypothetical protein